MGKALAILTAVITIGVILVFGRDFWSPMPGRTLPTEGTSSSLADNNRVAVTHAFKDGIHRYSGTFLLPHSCFAVKESGSYVDGQIAISFLVEDLIATQTTCLKITTRYPFTVLVEAPKEAPPVFTLNGDEVPSKIRDVEWTSVAGTLIDSSVSSPNIK